jgi:hypothetical protein
MGLAVPAACAAECNPREDAGAQLFKIISRIDAVGARLDSAIRMKQ